jgi:5'-3' exonuclease
MEIIYHNVLNIMEHIYIVTMGIPSYFSFIVKNHANIIRKLNKGSLKINNLYLDSNSIIYDAVKNIDFTKLVESDINTIIRCVIKKIDEYIDIIQPDTNIYIAFDGTAPVAKLEQQRQRRYKSLYQTQITKTIFKDTKPDPFNTTAITPGTKFMNDLNSGIKKYYTDPAKYNAKNIILSLSDSPGEGEHKLFNYIRDKPLDHTNANTIIYGLDADLIMLCLNHLPISDKIYLFRETPEFIKSINSELEPNENYVMDIPELANAITLNMNNGLELNATEKSNRIYDYIFICFFLGNDFMPHFPSINIRTGGVDKIINAYKATIGRTNEFITDGKTIHWKNVRSLVKFLADLEEEHLKAETKLRDKRSKIFYSTKTPEETFKKFDAIPTYERDLEKFINPFEENWQKRYYKALFDIENITEEQKKEICVNYLEGLEWTMKYYTTGCPDWRWTYKYNYPPLLCDLIHFVPYLEKEFVPVKAPNPVSELVQLCYVLPRQSLTMLPKKLYGALISKQEDLYKTDCDFAWSYCRYFWEAHVQLPQIDINELEKFVNDHFLVKK